jgi:hypothetical protein
VDFSKQMIQTFTGINLISYSIGYILFLGLYAIFLPVNADNSNYALLLSNKNWVWVNCIQILALISCTFGTIGLVFISISKNHIIAFIGLIVVVVGCFLMVGLSFTETFAWSTLSKIVEKEQIKKIAEMTLIEKPFSIASTIGFHLFSIGYIIIAICLIQEKRFDTITLLGLIVGCVLFSISFLVERKIRYKITPIVLIIICSSFISLGISIQKR